MARRLRIGYVMQNGAPDLSTASGPTLHVTAVIRGLQRIGHSVRVVVLKDSAVEFSDDLESWSRAPYGVTMSTGFRAVERPLRRLQRVAALPYWNAFESARYADAAARVLRDHDVIYERHGYLGYGGVLAARRLGIPIAIELNGNIVREIDAIDVPMSRIQRQIGRFVTTRTLAAADHVVVVAEALRRELVERAGLPSDRVTTVVNGADVELFARGSDTERTRQAFELGNGPLVTFVGTFQPWHGVEFLVDAFASIRPRWPAATLVLVGQGTGIESVRTRANHLPPAAVRFLGRLPQADVASVLAASHVLVAPYAYAHGDIVGTPLKLVEYMAAGRAIVASRAPIHDIVRDGETGLRVEPASGPALAVAIDTLLGDDALRVRLGSAARRAAADYSWDAVCQRLSTLLASLTAR